VLRLIEIQLLQYTVTVDKSERGPPAKCSGRLLDTPNLQSHSSHQMSLALKSNLANQAEDISWPIAIYIHPVQTVTG
jgi:hypothetical protein